MFNAGPNMTEVTMIENKSVVGEHLLTYQNIDSVQDCINICHMTR